MPPVQPESPAKAGDSATEQVQFENLAKHLFGVDRAKFQKVLEQDELERQAIRKAMPRPPGRPRSKP